MFMVKTECSGRKDGQAESTFSDKVGGSSFTRHGYDQYKSQAISKYNASMDTCTKNRLTELPPPSIGKGDRTNGVRNTIKKFFHSRIPRHVVRTPIVCILIEVTLNCSLNVNPFTYL